MVKKLEYLIIRDTREKSGYGWTFGKTEECLGTELHSLRSGDYSIKGYEEIITIERKFNTAELSVNIWEKRFEDELKRLEEYRYPYMVFEFEYRDVVLFPVNSGLPKSMWHKVKMTADIMEKTIARYMVKYKTKIIFAGSQGKQVAQNIFRSFMKYGIKN